MAAPELLLLLQHFSQPLSELAQNQSFAGAGFTILAVK
jgi:hypothetical protein